MFAFYVSALKRSLAGSLSNKWLQTLVIPITFQSLHLLDFGENKDLGNTEHDSRRP